MEAPPIHSCPFHRVLSPPHFIDQSFLSESPLCERKINLKEKILEIELEISILRQIQRHVKMWKIFENFYFCYFLPKYQKISIFLPLNGFLMERRFLIPPLMHTFSSSTVFHVPHSSYRFNNYYREGNDIQLQLSTQVSSPVLSQ